MPPLHTHTPLPFSPPATSRNPNPLLSSIAPVALALTLASSPPSLSIPFASSPSSLLPPTTPFARSKDLKVGLESGKIAACPSINPGCVSTNPRSASFLFPWVIPESQRKDAVEKLRNAILQTQGNAKIQVLEETPEGQYLQAEVDGGFGRDVMEFLVRKDTVAFRSMATKVTFVYPFTTALGDATGQKDRVNKIADILGWYSPKIELMD